MTTYLKTFRKTISNRSYFCVVVVSGSQNRVYRVAGDIELIRLDYKTALTDLSPERAYPLYFCATLEFLRKMRTSSSQQSVGAVAAETVVRFKCR